MALNVKIYNQAGKETGELELSRKVFGVGWKPQLVHEVAEAQRSSRRRRVACPSRASLDSSTFDSSCRQYGQFIVYAIPSV